MVNHPNRKVSPGRYPSSVLPDAVRAAGHRLSLLWEIPGPKDTAITWLSCYGLGKSLVIVETFDDGGWNAFTPSNSIKIDETIADVIARCEAES